MGDFDKLRPEVQAAFAICNAQLPDHDSDGTPNAWYHVRAELVRLAMIEADALIALDCEHDWQVEHERAEKAEAELAALKARAQWQPIEAAAREYNRLISNRDLYKRWYNEVRADRDRLGRSNASLRGQITKLRKRLAEE